MAQYRSISDWADAFLKKLSAETIDKAYLLAVQQTIGESGRRIFEQGMAVSGSIGKYSTSPNLYVSNNNSPRNGTLKGKNGDRKFLNGKPHKTTFYKSYSDFRSTVGRGSTSVNLVLSGRLYRNYLNSVDLYKKGAKPVTIPSMITPARFGIFDYAITLRKENMDKARGAEDHFGKKIFRLTKKEREGLKKRVSFELIKALNK